MLAGRAPTRQTRAQAPLGAVFALVMALITGSFMVVMPLVILSADPVFILPELPSNKQDAETLLYLLTFAVLLPLWLWRGPKIADRIRRGPNGEGLVALTGILTALLAASIALVRISSDLPWGNGVKAVLAAGIVWSALAALSLFRATRSEWRPLNALATSGGRIWAGALLLVLLAALAPVKFGHVDPPALIVGLIVAISIAFAYGRVGLPVIPRGWKLPLDALVVVVVLLAIPDMVILPIERAASDADASFTVYVIQFHQNLWLGAASQVLGGSALLVDTVSQYGIVPIYLIAAFLNLAPINYTALGFFDGALSAGVFAVGYLILRAAGVRRGLAAMALAVGVVALVWDLTFPMGGLLQHGALRFGLPILLVAFQVAGARWPRFGRTANIASLAVVGLSSVWALEAFLYVSVTWLALLLLRFTWQPAPLRWRWVAVRAAEVVVAWAITQMIFLLITLLASGSLPDWGLYLDYLRDFLTGEIGELTYDFTTWSRGFAVGAVYVASAAGLALLAIRAPEYVRSRQAAMVALAGLTGYGIGLFSYYDNRSLDHVLPNISLPALLLVTIWLALCLESGARFSLLYRRCVLGTACGFVALMVAVAWPAAGTRSEDSLLAYVIPGGPSLSSGFERIWDPPEFTPGSGDGERLIERYFAGEDQVPVLTRSELDVEMLVRSDKVNALGITDAKEMSWVSGPHEGTIDDAVDDLQAGDLMVVDNEALIAFNALVAGLATTTDGYMTGSKMEPIQVRALGRIAERFRLKVVASRPSGVTVVRLEPRQP